MGYPLLVVLTNASMRRKRILIPPQFATVWTLERSFITASFSDAIISLGGLPVTVTPPTTTFEELVEFVRQGLFAVDGVLLQGGNDIDPAAYGQENKGAKDIQTHRDTFEWVLITEAERQQIPIFGVCRGLQLLNAWAGGSLIQHLDGAPWIRHWQTSTPEDPSVAYGTVKEVIHPVYLRDGGLIHRILSTDSITVNSFHHQGVDRLATRFQSEATAADGLVEAFSDEAAKIFAVQWHPEGDFSRREYLEPLRFWMDEWVSVR
jgi:putative glutamine amidotransferase